MLEISRTRHRLVGFTVAVLGVMVCPGPADERSPVGKSRDEVLVVRRYDLMRGRVIAAKVKSDEPGFPPGFAPEPIFRYNDPTLGWLAGAVWKLGDEGRPRALLATELRRSVQGKPAISYEFNSLAPTPFSVRSMDIDWSPTATQFEFKPIPRATAPEATPQRRLRQLRELAKRFTCLEEMEKKDHELRLLPTPVDRYIPSKADRADGAIFLFTSGTNPEVVLLIESDGKNWSYAAGRMTSAEIVVLSLDGEIAWEAPSPRPRRDAPFAASIIPIDIPGLAADGSEISD